ncbi:endochitinase A-like [Heracleum sosnowskyi]|uniref:Endochitinase A-like n=1 Tax=Heracleum sosnowskyi TaxID=360622 RepID=A0AAD8I3B8_9APIA|nr:endochitinase A-like [Heracleum sosnowskyi]
MNRSFIAPERGMQGGVLKREQMRASVMKEKEDELALFLEMRRREKERNSLLVQNVDEFDAPLGLTTGSSPIFNIESTTPAPARKTAADEFLNSDNDKNDYDWLLTPPGTPLFPSLEMESARTAGNQNGSPKARPTALKSRLANSELEPTTRNNLASSAGVRRPSSSSGPGSRPATPTGRPTLTSASKPTLASGSKPSSITASKPSVTMTSRPMRSSTPTRATLPSTKPTVPARSSTPTSRSTARSSTPTATVRSSAPAATGRSSSSAATARSSTPAATARSSTPAATARSSTPTSRSTARSSTPTSRSTARSSTPTRPSAPATKPTSRAATPTRRPNTLSASSNTSVPSVKSPSVAKAAPNVTRNPAPPRPSSPTVRPRPWNPEEMPGFSNEVPPNLRTSLSDRPPSATRGRPGAPSVRSSSIDPAPNGRIRRQSCSPSRGRPPNGMNYNIGSSVPALNRAYAKANDNVSPVMYGTKMVERVINMRKLVPPKQDDKHSPRSNLSGKSSSPDSSGFGRNFSRSSMDMAIRHMDIRRNIPGNLRPLMTNIPASSMYSVRSGPGPRSRTVSVSDSPLATSSNASSEVSINNNALCVDTSEFDDDFNSERGVPSPASVRGR